MSKTIYDLKLHESMNVNITTADGVAVDYMTATRVPNGWIYQIWNDVVQEYVRDIFVPYSEEFK